MPARRGAWAIYQTFATADGEQLFLGITSNDHFRAFCERRREPYTRGTAQMLQTGWIETLSPCLFGFVRRLSRSIGAAGKDYGPRRHRDARHHLNTGAALGSNRGGGNP